VRYFGEIYNFCHIVSTVEICHPRNLRGYWTKVHQICTRCRKIIGAIKPFIHNAIFQFVLECQGIELRSVRQFCLKLVATVTSTFGEIEKEVQIRNLQANIYHLEKKNVKTGPRDPEIIGPNNSLKIYKRKRINARKHISHLTSLPVPSGWKVVMIAKGHIADEHDRSSVIIAITDCVKHGFGAVMSRLDEGQWTGKCSSRKCLHMNSKWHRDRFSLFTSV